MAHVELWPPDRIVIHSEYREKEDVKKVPGSRWDAAQRVWWCPLSWASCVALRGVFAERLTVGPALDDWGRAQLDGRVVPTLAMREASETDFPVANAERLDPLQRVGAAFAVLSGQTLLADGMGSGKTVMAICALETLRRMGSDPYPALVIAPNSMLYTWEREIRAWAPDRTVAVLKGGAVKRRKLIEAGADYLVVNWEAVALHSRLAPYGSVRLSDKDREEGELNRAGLRTVVADEAHRGKNPKAKQTRAWKWLSWHAPYRLAMSGTPSPNNPEDLWSVMNGVAPDEWPSKTAFVDRYGMLSWNAFGGMSVVGIRGDTRDELFRFLDPRFIRRPMKVVIPNIRRKLPPQVRELDLLPKQRRAYDAMAASMLADLDSGVLVATTVLAQATRLLQLASAYGELDEAGDLTLAEPSCKLDGLMELVDELGDEQLVVFAESRQLIELAARRLEKAEVPHGLVTGRVSELNRATNVQAFQEGRSRVLLLTMGAGGEGLTLTAARHVAFLQRSFSLVKNQQAEDRVYRRGQERDVQPIFFESRDTLESRVAEIAAEKGLRMEEIVRDQETLRRVFGG